MIKRMFLIICAALLFGGAAAQAQEDKYPTKPIRFVVGYSPGGGNDLIARIVAAKLQGKLGQPVVVDNKPGAQSSVAAEIVARAPADGYTLLVAPSGTLTINQAVYAKLPYDPVNDFAPISLLAEFPLLLVVGADQPIKSVRELIEYGRAKPGLANYASAATPFQLAAELFNQRTNSAFQHIPYRGSGDAAQAIVSGQVLMGFVDSGPVSGLLKAGKLRALAVTTARRPPDFSDVPTMEEAGVTDMEILLWTGLVAPARTSAEIVTLLQDAISETVEMPAVQSAMESISVAPRATTSNEFRDLIAKDAARWKAVADKANIKLE
jgi:tripartite-type tricarboxylate transporter receptor subunit TctC